MENKIQHNNELYKVYKSSLDKLKENIFNLNNLNKSNGNDIINIISKMELITKFWEISNYDENINKKNLMLQILNKMKEYEININLFYEI
jgi:hypothetical protein